MERSFYAPDVYQSEFSTSGNWKWPPELWLELWFKCSDTDKKQSSIGYPEHPGKLILKILIFYWFLFLAFWFWSFGWFPGALLVGVFNIRMRIFGNLQRISGDGARFYVTSFQTVCRRVNKKVHVSIKQCHIVKFCMRLKKLKEKRYLKDAFQNETLHDSTIRRWHRAFTDGR